jgi:hypothetical protein
LSELNSDLSLGLSPRLASGLFRTNLDLSELNSDLSLGLSPRLASDSFRTNHDWWSRLGRRFVGIWVSFATSISQNGCRENVGKTSLFRQYVGLQDRTFGKVFWEFINE